MNTPDIKQWHDGDNIELGVWDGVPNALYHGGPGISKSGLDDISISPLFYRTLRDNPKPQTEALEVGTAFHCLVLEPEVFEATYIPQPVDAPRRPSSTQRNAKKPSPDTLHAIAWWDRFESENGDKIMLSNKDDADKGIWGRDTWSQIHYMRDAVMAHPEASILLDPALCKRELSVYVAKEVSGVNGVRRLAKCRPDAWNLAHSMLVDLKSTTEATFTEFCRSVHQYRYDVQASWYHDLCLEAGVWNTRLIFVACEKEPPYHVGCYECEPEWVRQGRVKYEQALRTYSECMESGEWPGIADYTRILTQPAFARFNRVS
jgi:exodeoxyribonuclease VIII